MLANNEIEMKDQIPEEGSMQLNIFQKIINYTTWIRKHNLKINVFDCVNMCSKIMSVSTPCGRKKDHKHASNIYILIVLDN